MDVEENRVMFRAGLSGVTEEGCSGQRSTEACETESALPCGDGPLVAFPSQNVGKVQAGAVLSQSTVDGTFTSRLVAVRTGIQQGNLHLSGCDPTICGRSTTDLQPTYSE